MIYTKNRMKETILNLVSLYLPCLHVRKIGNKALFKFYISERCELTEEEKTLLIKHNELPPYLERLLFDLNFLKSIKENPFGPKRLAEAYYEATQTWYLTRSVLLKVKQLKECYMDISIFNLEKVHLSRIVRDFEMTNSKTIEMSPIAILHILRKFLIIYSVIDVEHVKKYEKIGIVDIVRKRLFFPTGIPHRLSSMMRLCFRDSFIIQTCLQEQAQNFMTNMFEAIEI